MSSQPVKQFGCQKIVTLGKYNDTYAKELISRSANQVFPIMLKRKWTVPFLTEFYPKDIRLLGLNRNRGQKVYIRLRPHFDEKTFLSYEDVLGTLLHELVHIGWYFCGSDSHISQLLIQLSISIFSQRPS
eukprot:Sdes_comp19567_c0_seq2m11243